MKHILFLGTVLATLCVVPVAQANTIDFTKLNIDATDLWSKHGVTVSGVNGTIFDSVKGIGLETVSGPAIPSVTIHVDGLINAFTLQPWETIDGLPGTLPISFGFVAFRPPSDAGITYRFLDPPSPITITTSGFSELPDTVASIGLFGDYGQLGIEEIYKKEHPDAVVLYGFSITSLDYTPTPEPATLFLFALGAPIFLLGQSRRRSKPRA